LPTSASRDSDSKSSSPIFECSKRDGPSASAARGTMIDGTVHHAKQLPSIRDRRDPASKLIEPTVADSKQDLPRRATEAEL
jgi:hypothetical protein